MDVNEVCFSLTEDKSEARTPTDRQQVKMTAAKACQSSSVVETSFVVVLMVHYAVVTGVCLLVCICLLFTATSLTVLTHQQQ